MCIALDVRTTQLLHACACVVCRAAGCAQPRRPCLRATPATDRTKEFQVESVTFFVEENLPRYVAGEELLNICDKAAGY